MKVNLNPDADFVKDIKKQMKKNNGYCTSALFKDKDTKCMCKEFRDQIKRGETGMCQCGLYIAVEENE